MTNKLTAKSFADIARNLDRMTTRVQSCAPDRDNAITEEEDYDAVSLSLARIMKTCAAALLDSGYPTEDAITVAERAIADLSRLQAMRGIAV